MNKTVNLLEIKAYFGTPENPVSTSEFKEFWASLTNEEKDEIKQEAASS